MKRHLLPPSLAALAAALVSPGVGAAQSMLAAPAPLSDADALAAQMRIIAAQPTDVSALAQAGELSARVGDLSGAASLFARADKVDPHSGRVKAGMAEVLLRSERPGEALRFFDQAEGYGYPPARFAAERGLAYDLLGQQGRAQRDYRLVLASGDNAEVRRRYALSLAISGQNEAALQELEPLIRKNDRGAWRSRAFIMAMAGDATGAGSIATTMMAPGQAQGLAPFFARLSSLGPVDRAFAVHFGELRPTAQRIADARLAPALPPFAPEVVQVARAAPVVAPAPVRAVDRRHRKKGEVQVAAIAPVAAAPMPLSPGYGSAGAARIAAGSSTVVATARPLAAPPSVLAASAPSSRIDASVRAAGLGQAYYLPGSLLPHYLPRPPATAPASSATPTALASTSLLPPITASRPIPQATSAVSAPPAAAAREAAPSVLPAAIPRASAVPVQLAAVASPTAGFSPASVGIVVPSATGMSQASVPVPPASAPATRMPIASPTSTTLPSSTAAPAAQSDAVLARIADALAIPGRELAAAGAATPTVQAEPVPVPLAAAAPTSSRHLSTDFQPEPMVVNGRLTAAGRAATSRRRHPVEIAAASPVQDRPDAAATEPLMTRRGRHAAEVAPVRTTDTPVEADRPPTRRGRHSLAAAAPADTAQPDGAVLAPPTTRHARRELAAADVAEPTPIRSRRGGKAVNDETGTDDPAPLDRKAKARQVVADRKASADKKAAAEKKALADKEAADERKAKKADPGRYWVQVAGGANEDDLPKAWSAAKSKAPALAGHKGWTTPLHATNRVVTGPFKTDEEARAFVNTLKKQGVSAFQFTSEAGQKVSRLDSK